MPDTQFIALLITLAGTAVGLANQVRVMSKEIRKLSGELCDVRAELAGVLTDYEHCRQVVAQIQAQHARRGWWPFRSKVPDIA